MSDHLRRLEESLRAFLTIATAAGWSEATSVEATTQAENKAINSKSIESFVCRVLGTYPGIEMTIVAGVDIRLVWPAWPAIFSDFLEMDDTHRQATVAVWRRLRKRIADNKGPVSQASDGMAFH